MNKFEFPLVSQAMSHELAACGVWITRPAEKTSSLQEAIEIYGGTALVYPTICIEPCAVSALPWEDILFDALIVTSESAVIHAPIDLITQLKNMPPSFFIAAIGRRTAGVLKHRGIVATHIPQEGGTEGLLALLEGYSLEGKRVLLLTGEGGRPELENYVRDGGGELVRINSYRRVAPKPFVDWRQWVLRIQVIVVTSVEAIQRAYQSLDQEGQHWLSTLLAVAASPRIALMISQQYPQQRVIVADSAHDADIISAILSNLSNPQ